MLMKLAGLKTKKKWAVTSKIVALIISAAVFFIWQNNSIVVSEYSYKNEIIPESFKGFRILQVSDLHNKEFGKNQSDIIEKIRAISPDIIVITGDIVDRRRYDTEIARNFVSQSAQIAPVYYVSGNHEAWSGKYSQVKKSLEREGALVLDNEVVVHSRGDQEIKIVGVRDPAFETDGYLDESNTGELERSITELVKQGEFEILLSHRPELMELYREHGADIVFSGHAHGGQIRIPFIGGIFAPGQGFFPEYDGGIYREGDTTMVLSRGLGNSIFPLRVFNRPELVVLTLD